MKCVHFAVLNGTQSSRIIFGIQFPQPKRNPGHLLGGRPLQDHEFACGNAISRNNRKLPSLDYVDATR